MASHIPRAPSGTDPIFTVLAELARAGAITVHNARGEFACNSSSTHSIVILPPGLELHDDDADDNQYGWDSFTLATSRSKIAYLATALKAQRSTELVNDLCAEHGINLAKDAYIDHQSRTDFPVDWYGKQVNAEYVRAFAALLTDPRVVILGGNDNGGGHPELTDDAVQFDHTYAGWRARHDSDADGNTWWTFFNDADGTKLRVSLNAQVLFDDSVPHRWSDTRQVGPFTPAKSSTPELVDIKLTDRCPFEKDCGFCYMGSTTTGDEGDLVAVTRVLTALAEQQVFEVAFGGGEPTTWPHLEATLRFARSVGIVPNFTTKNYAWLTHPQRGGTWLDLVGAVAFSVNSTAAMSKLTAKADAAGLTTAQLAKITVQVIPDIVPEPQLKQILTEAHARSWRVTLLGYKETGRGQTFTARFASRPAGAWIDIVRKLGRGRAVAIDTALAESSQQALADADVPAWMFHVEEGAFSAYIDMVTGRMGPSSYCSPDQMTDLDLTASARDLDRQIRNVFSSF